MEAGSQKYHDMKLTTLNIQLAELYEKISKDLSPPRPLPAETRDKRDKSKYCKFHKYHGHKTENFRALQIEVQRMIDAGKLQDGNGAEIRELGCTKIEFSAADMIGVYAPHNYAIVITAWIGMCRVHRILVDTGSSVSVLFSGAYSSMNLPHDLIEEDENPIIGFSGEVTKAIGKVKILITMADKSILGNFLLLDCRAPYNAIFLAPEGVVKFRSDQMAAHKCHESSMNEFKKSEVQIGDEEHKTTFVGADLLAHERDGLITLLRANTDVFAWSFAEMPGIDPNVSCHRLNIDEKFRPVRQKIRNMAQRKRDGVTAEVESLLEAGFIRPVQYPRWLSNVVPVPKKNGKIRVCIDFTDLNKACSSDPYPLPRIRDLVDATSWYVRLSFMDGETYQHLVDHMFKDLIGKSMEVYIDDMVVKSEQKESHFLDLQKTFDILRQYHMKLNPAKFFDVLKKAVNFGWKDECEKAFDEIKQYLSIPPVLVSPKTGQPIEVYLAATENVLKRILERADDSSRLAIWSNFLGAYEIKYETRTAEKGHALDALLADFHVDDIQTVTGEEEELFKPIEPTTDQTGGESAMEVDTPEPLWTVFTDGSSNVGGAGVTCVILTLEGSRIEKATRLGFQASNNEAEYEAAIIGLKAVKQLDAKNVKLVTDSMLVINQFLWTYKAKEERMALYLDHMRELANEFDQFSIGQLPRLENRHAGSLAYLSSVVETDTTCFIVVDFQELPSISDSHCVLAIRHASGGEGAATSAHGDTEVIDSNMDVDSPVIDNYGSHVENAADWRQPYIQYLKNDKLPEDEKLVAKVKKNVWRYSMIEGQLHRKPVAFEPFLRCISAEEGQQILREAHEGICGSHSGGRSLAHMILTQGYFWPYMQKHAKEYAQKCVPCQEHAPIPKRPANELHPVFSPWLFSIWGLDIVRTLPKAPGGIRFVLAATDYFTKWVEAVALVIYTGTSVFADLFGYNPV
ncbi:uncharacterized protein LOC113327899 [Papaver somniferum]|uniref:uncharacterized protein LOC113327899 n=1 Tax=Papaver somniferum TaxID=3469 RepID=UPI000E700504|nr:uncharacterized protein LOC113327899 [Papaver somniferum]